MWFRWFVGRGTIFRRRFGTNRRRWWRTRGRWWRALPAASFRPASPQPLLLPIFPLPSLLLLLFLLLLLLLLLILQLLLRQIHGRHGHLLGLCVRHIQEDEGLNDMAAEWTLRVTNVCLTMRKACWLMRACCVAAAACTGSTAGATGMVGWGIIIAACTAIIVRSDMLDLIMLRTCLELVINAMGLHMRSTYGVYIWGLHMGSTYEVYIWVLHNNTLKLPDVCGIKIERIFSSVCWTVTTE